MKTQEEYAREINEIVLHNVESHQSDWFEIDREIFMQSENKDRTLLIHNLQSIMNGENIIPKITDKRGMVWK